MSTRCLEVQGRLLAGAQDVSEDDRAHLEACPGCRASAAQAERYATLLEGARRANREDLAPSRWAAMRAQIDGAGAGPGSRLPLGWVLAAAALGVGVAWMVSRPLGPVAPEGGLTPAPPPSPSLAAKGVPALSTPGRLPEPPAISGVPIAEVLQGVADPASFRRGGQIEGGSQGLLVRAFGRHQLALAAGARVRIEEWSPQATVLEVAAGKLRSEVERRTPDEVFEVRSGETKVRVVGTVFEVDRRPDGAVGVRVEHGLVAVSHPTAGERRLGEGESWTVPPRQTAEATPLEPAAPEAEAPQPADPRKQRPIKLVEKDLGDLSPTAAPKPATIREVTGLHDYLVEVVGLVRGGQCGKAVKRLTEIRAAQRLTTDMMYLYAWCYRRLGKQDKAESYFALYRAAGSPGPWRVPASADEKLPIPRESELSP